MNKTEKTYNILLEDILRGRLYQGQKMVENDLRQTYNIGKTPLREALIQLERIGLVKREFNRGFTIRYIGRKDAEEIYDLREMLERLAVRKTIENITEEKVQILTQTIDEMAYHVKMKKIYEYGKLDMDFHILLCKLSGNERLLDIIKNLQYQIRLLLKTSINLPERGVDLSFNEHKELYNAILSKNADKAETQIRKHISRTKEAVLNYLDHFSAS
jgi:DNA-binding GntR family transcriptional regulator